MTRELHFWDYPATVYVNTSNMRSFKAKGHRNLLAVLIHTSLKLYLLALSIFFM